MQKIRFKAQCETANKDKQGQDSPGPGVTHSQGDTAHYSPFAVGRELKRRGRDGGCEGVGGCVLYEEERQLSPNGEKKGAISNQVPSAAQLATGQNTSVIRSLLTISPKSLRTTALVCNRLGNRGAGEGGRVESPGHSSCLPSTLTTNFLIRTSSGTAHCAGQARSCESGRVPDHQISTARHRVTSCLPSHIFSSAPLNLRRLSLHLHVLPLAPPPCPLPTFRPALTAPPSPSTPLHPLPKQCFNHGQYQTAQTAS